MAANLFLRRKPNDWNVKGEAGGGIIAPLGADKQEDIKYKPALLQDNIVEPENDTMVTPEIGAEREVQEKPSLFGERPDRPKPKAYDYILGLLLPALQAGLGGQGALSGAVAGASNMFANKFKNQNRDIADWEKDRAYGLSERKADNELTKIQQDMDYKKGMLDVSKGTLNLNKEKYNKPITPPKAIDPSKISDKDYLEALAGIRRVDELRKKYPAKTFEYYPGDLDIIKAHELNKKANATNPYNFYYQQPEDEK